MQLRVRKNTSFQGPPKTLGSANPHPAPASDSKVTRKRLSERGLLAETSEKGKPAPLGATRRLVVERTNSWHNAHKKLVWLRSIRRGSSTSGWPSPRCSSSC